MFTYLTLLRDEGRVYSFVPFSIEIYFIDVSFIKAFRSKG